MGLEEVVVVVGLGEVVVVVELGEVVVVVELGEGERVDCAHCRLCVRTRGLGANRMCAIDSEPCSEICARMAGCEHVDEVCERAHEVGSVVLQRATVTAARQVALRRMSLLA